MADITFDGDAKVNSYTIAKVKAKSPDYKVFNYRITDATGKKVKVEKGLDGWILFTGPAGVYNIEASAGKVDKDGNLQQDSADFTVTIGDPAPPIPPKPPGPTPDPDPFQSTAEGLKVLIVYESEDLTKYPAEQAAVLTNKEVRSLLNSKAEGTWHIWDKDVNTSNESAMWQKVMKRSRKSLPWIVIGNGKSGFEGPLPATSSATIELINKYAK